MLKMTGVHPATPPLTRGSWALGWGTIHLWMGGFDGDSTLPAQVGGSALGVGGGRLGGERASSQILGATLGPGLWLLCAH